MSASSRYTNHAPARGCGLRRTIALGGALGSLRHGLRSTFQTPHPRPPLTKRGGPIPDQVLSAKGSGASPDRTLWGWAALPLVCCPTVLPASEDRFCVRKDSIKPSYNS